MLTRTGKKPESTGDKSSSMKGPIRRRSSIDSNMEEELRKIKEQLTQVNKLDAEVQELRARQERYDEMENELQALRLESEQQRQRWQGARDDANNVGGNQNSIISSLLMDIHRINVEIKVPKFSDEDKKHPIEYLNEIENYFKVKNTGDLGRLLVIENSLEGKAKYWFDNNKSTILTFDTFKEKFRGAFFSIPVQMKIKEKWQAKIYKKEDKSLEMFFLEQLRIAKYFEPKILDFEINFKISKQLPHRAREALAGADFENAQTIISRLQYLDLNPINEQINGEKEGIDKDRNDQIRKLTVGSNRVNNRGSYYWPYNQNRPDMNNRAQGRNQQTEYNDREYQNENRQTWRNQSMLGNSQHRNQGQNYGYRNNRQYNTGQYNRSNRFNYNNQNRDNANQRDYQGANQRFSNNETIGQWENTRRYNNASVENTCNGYSYLNSNNTSNLTNDLQDSRTYNSRQNPTNMHHLN